MIERLLRRVRGQAPFLLVLALMAAAFGFLLVWPDHWRRGVAGAALSMLVAAALRLLLPAHRAGFLVVRRRWIDVAIYLVLGLVILAAAVQLG
ncbi:MAG: DUF3017 domain-containing protein [Jatrophihabitantaceae bacterium]